jgi:hypothetical protein
MGINSLMKSKYHSDVCVRIMQRSQTRHYGQHAVSEPCCVGSQGLFGRRSEVEHYVAHSNIAIRELSLHISNCPELFGQHFALAWAKPACACSTHLCILLAVASF